MSQKPTQRRSPIAKNILIRYLTALRVYTKANLAFVQKARYMTLFFVAAARFND